MSFWAISVPVVLLSALVTGATYDYNRRTQPSPVESGAADIAVVYSGGIDRVLRGIDLLLENEIDTLFVSGLDATNSYTQRQIAKHLALNGVPRNSLGDERLVFAGKAINTLQNAIETRCWLEREGHQGPILLLTSQSHMPRASLASERALPDRQVLRMTVPDRTRAPRKNILFQEEFRKYVATRMITRLPLSMWNFFSPDPAVRCAAPGWKNWRLKQ